jgi:hypothetical protein
MNSLNMIVAVLSDKYFSGIIFSLSIRLVFYTSRWGTYTLVIRLIRPALFTKMRDITQMGFPNFLAWYL